MSLVAGAVVSTEREAPLIRVVDLWKQFPVARSFLDVLRTPVGKIVGSIPELELADERPLLGKPFTP